jgi:cysteine desulfuration protein SufE
LLVPPRLDEMIDEFQDADRQERIELLLDFAKTLPPLPDRLACLKDATHRVQECQSPVFLFVEREAGVVHLFADAPVEAPTVRGFVAMLLQGLDGATAEEIRAVPGDLVERTGLTEILGMLRVHGLSGVLRRLKSEVARVASEATA